jgi:hypothetical protein
MHHTHFGNIIPRLPIAQPHRDGATVRSNGSVWRYQDGRSRINGLLMPNILRSAARRDLRNTSVLRRVGAGYADRVWERTHDGWIGSGWRTVVWADNDRVVGVTTPLVCFWTSGLCLSERRVCRVGHLFLSMLGTGTRFSWRKCVVSWTEHAYTESQPNFCVLCTTNLPSGCETQFQKLKSRSRLRNTSALVKDQSRAMNT